MIAINRLSLKSSLVSILYFAMVMGLVCAVDPARRLEAQLVPAPPNPGGRVPKLWHQAELEPLLGSLGSRGQLAVRGSVTRYGAQAVSSRDTVYFWNSETRNYRSGASRFLDSLTVPAGSTSATEVLRLRDDQQGYNSYLSVGTSLTGDGSGINGFNLPSFCQPGGNQVQCLFIVDDKLVQRKRMVAGTAVPQVVSQPGPELFPAEDYPAAWDLYQVLGQTAALNNNNQWMNPQAAQTVAFTANSNDPQRHFKTVEFNGFLEARGQDDLPESWQDLVPVDYLFISLDRLKALTLARPAAFTALQDWVAAGGRLVISRSGDDCGGLRALDASWFGRGPGDLRQLWSLAELKKMVAAVEKQQNDSLLASGSAVTNGNQFDVQQAPPFPFAPRGSSITSDGGRFNGVHSTGWKAWSNHGPSNLDTKLGAGEAVVASFGGGRIVGMPSDFGNWGHEEWKTALLAGLVSSNGPLLADSNLEDASLGFHEFEMPGLSRPPWLAFLGLITLFGIGVGPIAYGILKRRGKLPWMLGLVPLVGGTLTVSLLGYAVLSEGLGTRALRTSVTWLDESTGRGRTQTNIASYSGLAPGGMAVDERWIFRPDLSHGYSDESRKLEDRTTFSGGNQRSRTVSQLIAYGPTQGPPRKLKIEPDPSGGKDWTVTNQLEVAVSPVVVNLGKDQWLVVESLEPGASTNVESCNKLLATEALDSFALNKGSLLFRATATLRSALFEGDPQYSSSRRNQYQYYNPYTRGYAPTELVSAVTPLGMLLGGATTVEEIPEGTWMVLTEKWEPVANLMAELEFQKEYHRIHGRFK